MAKMKLAHLSEAEYRKFWEKSSQRCFMSAPEIAHLHEGVKVFYLGVKRGSRVIAAVLVRGTSRRWGYDYYAPRGPLMDYSDSKLVRFFLSEIKKYLRTQGGYIFRMDPNLMLVERDIDGHIVAGGKNNEQVVAILRQLGFRKSRYIKDVSQVTWQFVLPVKGKTESELLSDMKSSARRRLERALDLGIKIKNLEGDEIKSFYDVLSSTATRKHFRIRDYSYFQKMYQLFSPSGGIEFVSAIINPKEAISKLNTELAVEQDRKPKTAREKKNHTDTIKSLQTRIKNLQSLLGTEDREVVLSSGMFMTSQPEILHLLGGNVSEYLKLDGQYVLQREMICRAVRGGYERYNFYGIPENIDTHPVNYGIYEFKRGFSGHVEQLIGEYELPLATPYYLHKAISRIKSVIKPSQ